MVNSTSLISSQGGLGYKCEGKEMSECHPGFLMMSPEDGEFWFVFDSRAEFEGYLKSEEDHINHDDKDQIKLHIGISSSEERKNEILNILLDDIKTKGPLYCELKKLFDKRR